RLIIAVAERPEWMRIGDAAALLGVAPSTAHRLLQMLALHGFARQDPASKTYHRGETIARLSNPHERARQAARPLLAALVDEFGETAHLGVLEGVRAHTLLSVESPHLLRVGDRAGHRQPAHLSAMGRVLLSGADEDAVIEQVRAAGEAIDPAEFGRQRAHILSEGYILQHGEVEADVSALAAPVRVASDAVEYAIGVTFPTGRVREADIPRLAAAVQTAAAQLAEELRR
ncbi:MAG: IclR family transcriptional regulator, partial [Microbacterium sp.]